MLTSSQSVEAHGPYRDDLTQVFCEFKQAVFSREHASSYGLPAPFICLKLQKDGYKFGCRHQFGLITENYAKLLKDRHLWESKHYAQLRLFIIDLRYSRETQNPLSAQSPFCQKVNDWINLTRIVRMRGDRNTARTSRRPAWHCVNFVNLEGQYFVTSS